MRTPGKPYNTNKWDNLSTGDNPLKYFNMVQDAFNDFQRERMKMVA